jgi:hypothetical protein
MNFTVVRPVRPAASSTTATEGVEKLEHSTHSGIPSRTHEMDVPFADTVIRLDFSGGDFADTVPAADTEGA